MCTFKPTKGYNRERRLTGVITISYSLSLPSTRKGLFQAPEMQVLITVPRVEVYENEGASFLGEWTKTEVFEYDMMSYIMHRMLHER